MLSDGSGTNLRKYNDDLYCGWAHPGSFHLQEALICVRRHTGWIARPDKAVKHAASLMQQIAGGPSSTRHRPTHSTVYLQMLAWMWLFERFAQCCAWSQKIVPGQAHGNFRMLVVLQVSINNAV